MNTDRDFLMLASRGMVRIGGSFMSHLGLAMQRADSQNLNKIAVNWSSDMERYAEAQKEFEDDQENKRQERLRSRSADRAGDQ